MKPDPHTPAIPHEPKPGTEPAPPAERPRRKRILHPVFRTRLFRQVGAFRATVSVVALVAGLGLSAQNVPTPTTNPTGQSTTTTPPQAWVPFDDAMAADLQIPPEQLQQLRAVDERFMTDYRALGQEPMKDPRYQELIQRRNAEVRSLMNDALYTQWTTKYQPVPNTIQEQRGGGISTPPPPTP